jgi:hypothetical protein
MEQFKKIPSFPNYSISSLGKVIDDKKHKQLKESVDKDGYYTVNLSNKGKRETFNVHRLVGQEFIPNKNHLAVLDHKNNNRLDDRVSNLRWATYDENNENRLLASNNTSGHKGVSYDKAHNKWKADISANNKPVTIGSFKTKTEAINARQKEAKKLFGAFINKVDINNHH